jgi:hypothetical protein
MTYPIDIVLNLLAARVNKNNIRWYRAFIDDDYCIRDITCLICKEELHDDKSFLNLSIKLTEHGLIHLKDSNLLPFI